MKVRGIVLPLLAAALALPGALQAQEDDDCPCRRPGLIGVLFDGERDGTEGVRVIEVRRGSPAERAGVQEGDVVIRLNGADADEQFQALPTRLQAGDSVRLRIRRDGGERDVVVVAEPREVVRFGMVRPLGLPGGEPMVFVDGDSFRIPLQALTMRIDSLNTQLTRLDTAHFVRAHLDTLMTLLADSAHVFLERLPSVEFQMTRPESIRENVIVQGGMPLVNGAVIAEGTPFFMELGRRSAAGAELAEMNEGLSSYFGGQREGVLVIDVSPESPAARAGLQPGDVIVQAAGEAVEGPEDVRRALTRAENGRVALEVIRQGRRRELTLEWTGGERIIRRETRPRN